ncbi:uncharacterized protein METZ01_LOCUS265961, partial [marine metagenome]
KIVLNLDDTKALLSFLIEKKTPTKQE